MSDHQPEAPRLRPLTPAFLATVGVIGLALGVATRPVAEWLGEAAPVVSYPTVVFYLLWAALLGSFAWGTTRSRAGTNPRLDAPVAISRLALARASAIVAVLVLGMHLGDAASWLDGVSQMMTRRLAGSLSAAAAAAVLLASAVALERACRVSPGGDDN